MRFCPFLVLLLLLQVFPAWAVPPALQPLIDATPLGGVLRLPPGEYGAPALITKAMTLDGAGRAVLRGDGRSTVLTVRASGATVKALAIVGSGESHDRMDAGVLVEGDGNRIEGNVLEDVLFGIHVRQGNGNHIVGNRITGKDRPLGLRGDGVRLWNSRRNVIQGNRIRRVRDLTLANSPENSILGNTLRDGRQAMEFIFSPDSLVEGNDLEQVGAGIVVLYSPRLRIRGNRIAHAWDGGGSGIAFKESGDALVENNSIIHCAVGISANAPLSDESILTIRGNRFAHNVTGLYFYGEAGGHRILNNRFEHNFSQVGVSAVGAGSANVWRDNYWSDYQGFDHNGDGIGDTPHEIYIYADRIWMETPLAGFFRASPALELLDFLERLAPFASPAMILSDPRPRMR
ncbi:MAG: nitrous oxide reductase family maturation protein NosD [Rhodocyclaceae bacterium]|nr:nitrous oxide reductase family maturation protein NosD [Rhodocyclaceae bacterium]